MPIRGWLPSDKHRRDPHALVDVQRITLEKILLSSRRRLPNDIKVRFLDEDLRLMGDSVFAEFQTYIAGIGGESVTIHEEWPRDWCKRCASAGCRAGG